MSGFNHKDGHYLAVDGAQIYVEQQGTPDGPALILLHGGLGDMQTFNAIAPHLGQRHRLIGIDSRGQGKSTLGSLPLTYARLQRDVEAVIRHLQLSRFSVIGHSDGAIVALRLAAAGASRPRRLVTLGAHWALEKDEPTRARYAGMTASAWRERFPGSVARYQALNPQADFDRLMDAVRQLWLDDGATGYPGEAIRDIGAELLVIHGDNDPLVARAHALGLAERVASAKLLNLPFAGHSVHEERPDWLLPVLELFLQEAS
ncbi:Pimeloyl-ACP methyl ester carboxylesterase [Pseudomonas flavescens]|uniref:Pimeloyl-ACP methyl ester carboxylesterase n=1 Tax=Phytopseudomonas flavescens TaxID=29435 RepID=A0A1G8FAU0_9GAMM|nr:alpha/beta hydrolase [Pseudomonas flavescens]SDH79257.1 Pimeloyl-ACP methyl ester carboxylesterase [Pseudomonas flavescens]